MVGLSEDFAYSCGVEMASWWEALLRTLDEAEEADMDNYHALKSQLDRVGYFNRIKHYRSFRLSSLRIPYNCSIQRLIPSMSSAI
jgi:hypothetical protein